MVNTEQLAVNAVSNLIGACPLLTDYFSSNDKTPVTDGHIDVYSDPRHRNVDLRGRVPVQIKGSASGRRTKEKRATASFSVEREVLDFLRTDGGGLYFYVEMRPDGTKPQVFSAALTPFKIDRYLRKMGPEQKSISIELRRFPSKTSEIEKIVAVALAGRKQGKTEGFDESMLTNARGFTIHSTVGLNEDRPTVLNLEKSDFAVTLHTANGMSLPVDLDLTVYPASYVPREVDTPISCGEIRFENPIVAQTAKNTVEIRLSEGLRLSARQTSHGLSTEMHFSSAGNTRSQLKDVDFFLAARAGNPLVFAGRTHTVTSKLLGESRELLELRAQLSQIIELFDALDIDGETDDILDLNDSDRSKLLVLHEAFVRGQEIELETDGFGRYDFTVGRFKIMAVIIPGTDAAHTGIIDPFDPSQRSRFRIYRMADDKSVEEIDQWGTVYEALTVPDLASTLNLRLSQIVPAYEALEDRAAARGTANHMTLNLIRAADTADGPRSKYLLQGASDLNDWLLEQSDDKVLHQINSWQIRVRQGRLSDPDRREIRATRRHLQSTADSALREACLTILLDEKEELDLILQSLSSDDVEKVQSWPIYALVSRSPDRRDSEPLPLLPGESGAIPPVES